MYVNIDFLFILIQYTNENYSMYAICILESNNTNTINKYMYYKYLYVEYNNNVVLY